MSAAQNRGPIVDIRRRRKKDGSYSETPTVRYYDSDGIRRRKTCASVEEAEAERARMALDVSRGERLDGPLKVLTVAELWPIYRADAALRLEENTLVDYDGHWRRRLEPRFGGHRLDEINPRAVSLWRTDLQAAGVGPEAIRKAMVLLQAMFTVAVEWGEIDRNPVSLVRKPRQGRTSTVEPLDPLSIERIRQWMLEHDDLFSATLVSVLAYAGPRPGEALGLECRHTRVETMLIEQAVARGKLKLQKTGRLYRTVDLLDHLRVDKEVWIEGAGLSHPRARMFARTDGELFTREDWANWRKRHFHAATQAVGLGKPRPYDLRHSFASLLIREGKTSIVELAEQLGHSPTETLKTYGHVFSEFRRQTRVAPDLLIAQAREQLGMAVAMPTAA